MKSLVVLTIEREIKKGQKTFSDKTVNILLATIDAYEKQAVELKRQLAAAKAEKAEAMK